MTIIDEAEVKGTSPAGKTVRTIIVRRSDDGRIAIAIQSSQGQFMGDCWLDSTGVTELAEIFDEAATTLASEGGAS